MKRILTPTLLVILIGCCFQTQAQTITDIAPKVSGNTIIINYSVSGLKFNQWLTVSLFLSLDGGITYQGPMKEVSGDIGPNIRNGSHAITWEVMKEYPLDKANVLFDVRGEVTTEKIKRSIFVAYNGNLLTPLGLRAGTLGKTSWYLMLQSNLTPALSGSYTYENGTITDYEALSWYEFTSKHKTAAYTLCLGATFQAGRNIFLYTGAGYGIEEYWYEIKEYSYEGDTFLRDELARDKKISSAGAALEAGMIFRTGRLLLTGGASTVMFNTVNWEAGLGISF